MKPLLSVRELSKAYSSNYSIFNKKIDNVIFENVTFDLFKGDFIGVVGENGSGKSSLLKIISGLSLPTSGEVYSKKRIVSIIEITSGFANDLSVYENISLLLNISDVDQRLKKDLCRKIINFAALESFSKSLYKNLSSGMKSRLGFALSIHMNPEILILDEVLSVGDFKFSQKCFSYLNKIKSSVGIIFVSHSFNAISLMCNKLLVFSNKTSHLFDSVSEGLEFYKISSGYYDEKIKKNDLKITKEFGEIVTESIFLKNISCMLSSNLIKNHETIMIDLNASFTEFLNIEDLIISFPIYNSENQLISHISSDNLNINLSRFINKNKLKIRALFPNCLISGTYRVFVSIHKNKEYIYRNLISKFSVINTFREIGYFNIPLVKCKKI